MARFRYFTDEGICVEVFEGPGPSSPIAMVLLGMPATIGESEVTRLLNSEGFTVVQPHYAGTYDSAGEFHPAAAVMTARAVAKSLVDGEVIDVKNQVSRTIASSIALLVGYSFGAHVACHALHSINAQGLLLISPAISYGTTETGFKSEDITFLDYVTRSRPYTYRIGNRAEWKSLFQGDLNSFEYSKERTLSALVISGETVVPRCQCPMRVGVPS